MSQRLISLKELAVKLGDSDRRNFYRRWRKYDNFPTPVDVGDGRPSFRFLESEVDEFIEWLAQNRRCEPRRRVA